MPAILDSYQVTINRITGDASAGYWWIALTGNAEVFTIQYTGPSSVTESAANLFYTDTFIELLSAMISNSVSLPQIEVDINIDSIAEAQSLQDQFNLTEGQLNAIEANFDLVALCKLFGAFELVKKLFLNGNLNLVQLSEILLYLGATRKISEQKVRAATGFLLINQDINQVQYDAFWAAWAQQVG